MCYNKFYTSNKQNSIPLSCTPALSMDLVCSVFESSVIRLDAFFPLCTCHMQERSMDSTFVHRAPMLSILPGHDTLQDLGSQDGQDSAGMNLEMSLKCPQVMTSNTSGAQDNPHDPNLSLEQKALLNFWICPGRDWIRTIPALPHILNTGCVSSEGQQEHVAWQEEC